MAIETTANRISYAGNGVTTGFAFPYKFLANADLVVIVRNNTTGVETTKTLTTHYTVTGAGEDAGGTVTMLSAPSASESLIIYNDPAATQGVDLRENDNLPAEVVERAFDRLTVLVQRLKDRVSRAVRLSDGFTPSFDPTLPSDLDDAAGKIPLINDAGTGFADAADWPDSAGLTADMAASAAAAAASATAASGSATAAAGSASAASTSAGAASTSASAASSSASAASSSASAAAASASAAASTLASALWRGVVRKTFADSPYTVTSSDNGKLIVVDTTGGAVVINLPSIAAITTPFTLGVQLDAGTNGITINRNGTDTIDGATSKSITVTGSGAQLLADTTPAPDEWEVIDFGAQAGNMTADTFSGTGAQTAFTLSVDPGSKNNTDVYVEGIYQQKSTYSLSGTTLTFTEAPPSGTNNVEVISGTVLTLGTPSDATVTKAKFAGGAPKVSLTASKTGAYSATSADDLIPCNATGGAFTVTLPAAASNAGMVLEIIKTDSSSNAVTVDGNSSETINGALTVNLTTQYDRVRIICDGSNWHLLNRGFPGMNHLKILYPQSSSNYWNTTSGTMADFSVTGTIPTPTTMKNGGMGTISKATSNLPGFSFVAPKTGTIEVRFIAHVLIQSTTVGTNYGVELLETTTATTLDNIGSGLNTNAANFGFCWVLTGFLDVTQGTTYNFKIRGFTSVGTLYIGAFGTGTGGALAMDAKYVA